MVSATDTSFGRSFSSLRIRNFRLFAMSQLVSTTGNWLTNVALTLLVLRLTDSGVAIGWLAACQYGPFLVLGFWGGSIADRVDKRRTLMVTQALEMGQSACLAVLAFMPHPPVPALFAVAAGGGILLAFDNPLRRAFVTEMVPLADRGNAVVLYSTITNVSKIVGPALAGLLVVTVGYGWCFAIDGASYVLVLVGLKMMRTEELHHAPPRPVGAERVRLRTMVAGSNIGLAFALLVPIGTLTYNYAVTLPLFVTRGLGGDDGSFTFVYALFSAGAVIGSLVVAKRNLIGARHIVAGAGALGFTMLFLAAAPNVLLAGVAAFFVGSTGIVYMTASTAIVQVEGDPGYHGRLLAIQVALLVGTAPIGGPALGFIADQYGSRAPIVIGAITAIVTATVASVVRRGRLNLNTSS